MNDCCEILLLHDYFETTEGGGRLILYMKNLFPSDLGCGFFADNHPFFIDKKKTEPDYIVSSKLNIPLIKQMRLVQSFLNVRFIKSYKAVVYSGYYAPLAAINNRIPYNILYCHTPPRFLYDQKSHFENQIPCYLKPLLRAFNNNYKKKYEDSIEKMDLIIANSKNVQSRIKKYLNKESSVIYPPCDTNSFKWIAQEGYFLSMARLDPLKQVEKIVRAFRKLPSKRLIVISEGREFNRIKKLSKYSDNIEVKGVVSDNDLYQLVGSCLATIYIPKNEDFGMSPVESMAAGKPVIGVAEGGLLETVIHEKTGFLLKPDFKIDDLVESINYLTPEKAKAMRFTCEKRARDFDISIFYEKMASLLSKT